MDGRGGQEDVQDGLDTINQVEVDVEGSENVLRAGVAQDPVKERHTEGERAHHSMQEPLQGKGEGQRSWER